MTVAQPAHKAKAEALLLIVVLIWASNYPIAKYGIAGLGALVFNSIRYIVAAVVMGTLFAARSTWVRPEGSDWLKLLRAGIVASVIYQMAFIIGLSMTTAGNSAVLLSTSPLWTIYLNARLQKERIFPAVWLGMAVSLCGVIMIIVGSGKRLEFGSNAMAGDVISLAAAAMWGLNTNLQKPLLTKYSAVQLTFVLVLVGAVGLTLFAIPSALSLDWSSVQWTHVASAIVSGALSIAAANVFWSHGVQRLGPGRTANFNNLVPVLAFLISAFTLDEGLYLIQFVGAGVTIFGVWVARR